MIAHFVAAMFTPEAMQSFKDSYKMHLLSVKRDTAYQVGGLNMHEFKSEITSNRLE